jgi:hypothetical protein
MTRLSVLIGTAALACALSTPAQAAPILGQSLIATGGDVVVTFVSNGAGYTSELYLDGPAGDGLGSLFNNVTTPLSTSLNLGSFLAGTELVFRLEVRYTGNRFYSGDGSRNADGIAHTLVTNTPDQIRVGFEDLFGGGDFDYNDLVFAFSNVTGGTGSRPSGATPTPQAVDEPTALVLFGGGLAALVATMKRQSIKR